MPIKFLAGSNGFQKSVLYVFNSGNTGLDGGGNSPIYRPMLSINRDGLEKNLSKYPL